MTPPILAKTQGGNGRRNRDAGITLIEILVVLAVIGVATGATMLGVNSADRDTRAEAEAVRLARNLSLGVDEALVGGAPLAMIWDTGGYSFVAWSDASASWGAAGQNTLAIRHDLRAPLQLGIDGQDIPRAVVIAASGVGPAISFVIAPPALSSGPRWVVDFDGFSAAARPEGAE